MFAQIKHHALLIIVAFLFALCFEREQLVAANPPVNKTAESPTWEAFPQAYGHRISMASADDGWIMMYTGNRIFLFHWDGVSWQSAGTITSPLEAIIRGDINMVSPTDGWIVLGEPIGDETTKSALYRWNGSNWTHYITLTDPNGISLAAIDMLSATDGWAIGSHKFGSFFYHWNGSSWGPHTTIWYNNYVDQDIDMLSSTHGWAAGWQGTIYRWDGISWQKATSPVTTYLRSIDVVSPTDGWIVGEAGVILHWNGSAWSQIASPVTTDLASISVASARDAWAVGGTGDINDPGVILHWDGSDWSQAASYTTDGFNDIQMISGYDGWIVGFSAAYHYDPSFLSSNYHTGKTGSYFNISGSDYPPDSPVEITVNDHLLPSSLTTDASGNITFTFGTAQADPGSYEVTASVNPEATTRFTLSPDDPLRSKVGTWPVIDIPAGIAFRDIFLPLVSR